jgi:hypothetical protein
LEIPYKLQPKSPKTTIIENIKVYLQKDQNLKAYLKAPLNEESRWISKMRRTNYRRYECLTIVYIVI